MRFDLVDLRLFLNVVEAGTITGGAFASGLSLPAASERIGAMELAAETQLLVRSRKGAQPTVAGEALLHHARDILRHHEMMKTAISRFSDGKAAAVSVTANSAAVAAWLPRKIGPWMARNSDVEVTLNERPSIDVARSVAGGLADFGILSTHVDTMGLALSPFAEDRLMLIAPKDHPMSGTRVAGLSDAHRFPFIALGNGALQQYIERHAAEAGVSLRIRLRLPALDAVFCVVAAGAGIAVVPESSTQSYAYSNEICSIRLIDDWAIRTLAVCYNRDIQIPPVATDLMGAILAK